MLSKSFLWCSTCELFRLNLHLGLRKGSRACGLHPRNWTDKVGEFPTIFHGAGRQALCRASGKVFQSCQKLNVFSNLRSTCFTKKLIDAIEELMVPNSLSGWTLSLLAQSCTSHWEVFCQFQVPKWVKL